jgi:hypothetical protein
MKWLLIFVIVLAAPVIIAASVGAMLPRTHVASRNIVLPKAPQEVWAVISGPPTWRAEIRSYQEMPAHNGHRMWKETDSHGQTIAYEEMEAVPPSRLVTRIADMKLPFGGTWTIDVTPSGAGSSVKITENGEVYNPVFRFMSRFVIGQTATIDAYLKSLRTKLG